MGALRMLLQQLTTYTNCGCSCTAGHVLLRHRQHAHHMPCSPSCLTACGASDVDPALASGPLRLPSLHEVLSLAALLCSVDSTPALQCTSACPQQQAAAMQAARRAGWASARPESQRLPSNELGLCQFDFDVSVWLSRLALAQPARGAQLSCSAVLCRQHACIAMHVCLPTTAGCSHASSPSCRLGKRKAREPKATIK